MAIKVVDSPLPETTLYNIGSFPLVDEFSDEVLHLPPEKLEQVIASANHRYEDTGDMSPLILGHTLKDAPESEQPPIMGYLRNFRLGQIGKKDPRPAIWAEHLILPEWLDRIKDFPRRSIEFWGEDGLIDPVAALGATTPHRALGLALSKARYKVAMLGATTPHRDVGLALKVRAVDSQSQSKSRGGTRPKRALSSQPRLLSQRTSKTEGTMADANEIQNAIASMPLMQQLGAMLPVLAKLVKEYEEGEANAPEELAEEREHIDETVEKPEELAEPEDTDEEETALDMATPGGNAPNTHVPALSRLQKPAKTDKAGKVSDKDAQRLRRDESAIRLSKLEEENTELRQTVQGLVRMSRKTEREAALKQLLFQGYDLNLAEELADVVDLSPKQFAKHLKRIESSYRKTPRGSSPIQMEHLAPLPTDEQSPEASAKLAKKAGEYALKHKIPMERFGEALAAVKAGQS